MTDRSVALADDIGPMQRSVGLVHRFHDAFKKHYMLGRDRLISNIDMPGQGTILELGCDDADTLLDAAASYPLARLYGIAFTQEAFERTREAITRAGSCDRISVAHAAPDEIDAGALFGVETFDRVYTSYALSNTAPWRTVVSRSHDLIGRAGWFLALDFGRFDRLSRLTRTLLTRWLAACGISPRADLKDALLAEAAKSGRSISVERPYGGVVQFFVMR